MPDIFDAVAVGQRRRVAAAEDQRADGLVKFVDQAAAQQRPVQLAVAFAEDCFDAPLFPEPPERGGEIELTVAERLDVVRDRAEPLPMAGGGAFGGEDDDGREAIAEDVGVFFLFGCGLRFLIHPLPRNP